MQRNIHDEVFNLCLGVLAKEKVGDIFEGLSDRKFWTNIILVSMIQKKTAWIQRHISDSGDHFSMRLIALGVYTKIFLTTLQTIIFQLVKVKDGEEIVKLPGLVYSVAKLKYDMGNYFEAVRIIRKDIVKIPSEASVHSMVRGAVAIEQQFVDEIKSLCGARLELFEPLNDELIKLRVESVADSTLKSLGYGRLFKTKDPMPWIEVFAKKEALKHCEHEQKQSKVDAQNTSKKMDVPISFSIGEDF